MVDLKGIVITTLESLGIETSDILIKDDVDLVDYVIDSITFISFIVELEEKLNIEIPDAFLDLEGIGSLNGFVNMIESIRD